jgi:ribosomal protein L11 methyltransferase
VQAIDIDEKSVENAKENAALNEVEIDVRLGDSVPAPQEEEPNSVFDLILANIHRNILIENMPSYAAALVPGGELWLSGFYEDDCPSLISSAKSHGLHHQATRHNGEWYMLQFMNAHHP